MKDLWQKKIQDKMADFEVEEPEGLWDLIEQRHKSMSESPEAAETGSRPAIVVFGARLCALAAVLALLLGFAGLWLILGGHEAEIANSPEFYADSEPVVMESVDVQLAEQLAKISDKVIACSHVDVRTTEKHVDVSAVDVDAEQTVFPDSVTVEKKEAPVLPTEANKSDRPVRREAETYNYDRPIVTKRTSRLTFGLYASGGNSSSIGRTSSPQPVSEPGVGIDQYMWADDPMLGIILLNRGNELKTSIKHRQPVRFGLSLRYDFNDRLGIESGLAYTKLDSDIREGSDKHYFVGNQSLHYVGIPVNLKYRLFTWKFIDLYASAGGMVEKCVSASQTRNYVIENVVKSSETDDLKVKPLQWSVNASAGVQFRLTKFMGVYAEPGIAYYFDDGSDVRTIYKEKPVNFNLNLGLRFEL